MSRVDRPTASTERLDDGDDGADDLEAAWAAEIERRVAELERGEAESVPAEEVFARYGLGF